MRARLAKRVLLSFEHVDGFVECGIDGRQRLTELDVGLFDRDIGH